jgi:hypothetical protein
MDKKKDGITPPAWFTSVYRDETATANEIAAECQWHVNP